MAIQPIVIQRNATDAAKLLKPDGVVNKRLLADKEHRLETKLSGILIGLGLVEEIGMEKLETFPVPNSEGGNNPDKYEERPEKGRTRKSSFYKDMARSTAFVRGLVRAGEVVDNALSKEATADNPHVVAKRSSDWLEKEKKLIASQINAAVSLFLSAVAMIWQQWAIAEYPDVEVDLEMDGDAIARRSAPITIWELFPEGAVDSKGKDRGGQRTGRRNYFTLGEFNALSVERATEKGGTFDSLCKSGQREPKPKDLAERVKTAETFDDYVTSLWYYFNNSKGAKERLEKYLTDKENSGFAKAFNEVFLEMDAIRSIRSVRKAIEAATGDDMSEEAEKEKAAEKRVA